ncbi:hypothetical protein M409DRAFT_26369 [Zasmidium cellare ATCC 36951]|uniref:NTF2-like domain-containing protein n=1 Tax=Zasmidium cellare ATCC 36951 TaxID=1080233 RepID=A0A6A6CBN4_ZASCE|nr:uncharacterized protein M409DRAFT_26369 [Zasmidium cellare ATCC 36951]KAF2163332.1 hypothetical protein M409DRAFT_26369 [Zasmidium cellare ATCC 36951]
MKSITLAIPFAIAALVHASSLEPMSNILIEQSEPCLAITQSEAESFIQKFATTIDHTGDWEASAKKILAKDFVFASNPYISRNHLPVVKGPSYGIAASDRKTYIEQLAALTVSDLTTDDVLVTDCGKVIWRANVGSGGPVEYPSKIVGILTLEREKKKKGVEGALVATRWECEFDSVGWSIGLGLDCDTCVGPPAPGGYVTLSRMGQRRYKEFVLGDGSYLLDHPFSHRDATPVNAPVPAVMKLLSIVATFPLITLAFAGHENAMDVYRRNQSSISITDAEAASFVADFATLFEHPEGWKKTADQILSKYIVFASNSFLTRRLTLLEGGNSTGIVAQDREAVIDILDSLSVSNISTDDILTTTCGKIIWRANFGAVGPVNYPVKLMFILTLKRANEKRGDQSTCRLVATKVENEYDSMGWSIGAGLDCGSCAVSGAPEHYA